MHIWRRKWQPTPVSLPGESQGWGSLVGCHLWGHTKSDTTAATWQQQQQQQWTQNLLKSSASWRPGKQLQCKPQSSQLTDFFSFSGRSVFLLLRPSTDSIRPTHIMQSNHLYSDSINLNVNLIQKHLHKNAPGEMTDEISENYGLVKLKHQNNHFSPFSQWFFSVYPQVPHVFPNSFL